MSVELERESPNEGEDVEEEEEEEETLELVSLNLSAFCRKALFFCRIVPTLSLAKGIDSVEELLETFTVSEQLST